MNKDISAGLREQVQHALQHSTPLKICGGGSKDFLGQVTTGDTLDVTTHCGIVNYQPTELALTARAGTPLSIINDALSEQNQMLAFEPPAFGEQATLGGTIACNLSGPARPYVGAARDFVLGSKIINGKGEILNFGGEVMKNVAGYDVSRLMAGAFGTLGVLLEISIKVLPKPEQSLTLVQEHTPVTAISCMNLLAGRALPLTAACHDGIQLHLRFAGSEHTVNAVKKRIGGESINNENHFWQSIREHEHAFFKSETPLWRLSVAPATPPLALDGKWMLDWGGAQRWLKSSMDTESIRRVTEEVGGHATQFRTAVSSGAVFHPLSPGLLQLHRNLKLAFDPKSILNPGRLYPEL